MSYPTTSTADSAAAAAARRKHLPTPVPDPMNVANQGARSSLTPPPNTSKVTQVATGTFVGGVPAPLTRASSTPPGTYTAPISSSTVPPPLTGFSPNLGYTPSVSTHTSPRAPAPVQQGRVGVELQSAIPTLPTQMHQNQARRNKSPDRRRGTAFTLPGDQAAASANNSQRSVQTSQVGPRDLIYPPPTPQYVHPRHTFSGNHRTDTRGFRSIFTVIFWTSLALITIAFLGALFNKR